MPEGVVDECPNLIWAACGSLNGAFEKGDTVGQRHGVPVSPPIEGNPFVEAEKSMSARDSTPRELLSRRLVLDEDGDVLEAVPEGFRDRLPGLVDQLFESCFRHRQAHMRQDAF